PQDRISLAESREAFRAALANYISDEPKPLKGYDSSVASTFPASDPPSPEQPEKASAAPNELEEAPNDPHRDLAHTCEAGRAPIPVTMSDGTVCHIDHGAVVIAAITSCTNTSNPAVMMAAALLAKNAVEKGLQRKPWVKTSLAPGSRVVTDYYDRAGLTPYLEALGFHLVGYGCTTCIGNSGPLPEAVSREIHDRGPVVVSVLSGNRNFEGRIHSEVRANYLMSPPLVVAYALAGRIDVDLYNEPLGVDQEGRSVFLKDIWPTQQEVQEAIRSHVKAE